MQYIHQQYCKLELHRDCAYFRIFSHDFLNTILNGQSGEVPRHNISPNLCLSVTDIRELGAGGVDDRVLIPTKWVATRFPLQYTQGERCNGHLDTKLH